MSNEQSSMNRTWFFAQTEDPTNYGITDANSECFRKAPLPSLAKEICQNSIDANLEDESVLPTKVEFHSFYISKDKIPQFEQLKEEIRQCKEVGEQFINDSSTANFFSEALDVCNKEEICVLRISDFNTTGIIGSESELPHSVWNTFIKSIGVSDKADNKGGSKGVGKFACFAVSKLNTVFYSTLDKDSKEANIGVAQLISHNSRVARGYCGVDKGLPIYKQLCLDPDFEKRHGTNYGTDIYVIGFDKTDEWEKKIIFSTISNFFVSIFQRKLEVKVEGEQIDKDTLPKIIEKYKDNSELKKTRVNEYYQVLIAPETQSKQLYLDIESKYKISLKLMLDQNFSKSVAMVRMNGMKIYDQKNFQGAPSFSGVMIVEDKELNSILKKIEDPQHSQWKSEKKDENDICKAIKKAVRDAVLGLVIYDNKDEINLKLGAYLASSNDNGDNDVKQEVISSPFYAEVTKSVKNYSFQDKLKHKKRKSKSERNITQSDVNYDEDGNNFEQRVHQDPSGEIHAEPSDNERHPKHESTNQQNPLPSQVKPDFGEDADTYSEDKQGEKLLLLNKKQKEIQYSSISAIDDNVSEGKYELIVNPMTSAENAYISVMISAESTSYKAEISKALLVNKNNLSELKVLNGNNVSIGSIKKNQQIRLKVTLNDEDERVSFEVKMYGN